MRHPRYEYKTEGLLLLYEFNSEGPRGKIKKVIEYSQINIEDVYNLAFGDYDEITGEINDISITNNGDSQKVLATVASTVYAFTANIQMSGFLRQEVQLQERACIESELLTICWISLPIFMYMD